MGSAGKVSGKVSGLPVDTEGFAKDHQLCFKGTGSRASYELCDGGGGGISMCVCVFVFVITSSDLYVVAISFIL